MHGFKAYDTLVIEDSMDVPKPVPLRSLGEALGGYILLPRLIDKVRLLAQGQLPQAYAANVLNAALTLGNDSSSSLS